MEVTTNEGMHTTSLSVLPELLLNESCVQGEESGEKAQPWSSLKPEPLLSFPAIH